jgi:hypothetical protein
MMTEISLDDLDGVVGGHRNRDKVDTIFLPAADLAKLQEFGLVSALESFFHVVIKAKPVPTTGGPGPAVPPTATSITVDDDLR